MQVKGIAMVTALGALAVLLAFYVETRFRIPHSVGSALGLLIPLLLVVLLYRVTLRRFGTVTQMLVQQYGGRQGRLVLFVICLVLVSGLWGLFYLAGQRPHATLEVGDPDRYNESPK